MRHDAESLKFFIFFKLQAFAIKEDSENKRNTKIQKKSSNSYRQISDENIAELFLHYIAVIYNKIYKYIHITHTLQEQDRILVVLKVSLDSCGP